MQGVLAGFVTIGTIIGLGALLAQLKILDLSAQRVLARLAFFVASPALMVTVLGGTDVSRLFSANLVASVSSVVVVAGTALLLALLVWHRTGSETVIATFCAGYVNAANLGLPIAAYVLGDASLVAPMLLTQLLFLQPLGLAVLDALHRRRHPGPRSRSLVWRLSQPLRNPLSIGSLVGLGLALTGWQLPRLLDDPLRLVGGMAVPAMLLAYGVSLRLGPRPGAGEPVGQIGVLVGLKMLVQPSVAYGVGAWLVGLEGTDLLAVTVIAALPTAQNVFTHAVRYDTAEVLARDAILISTVASVPVMVVIAALLG